MADKNFFYSSGNNANSSANSTNSGIAGMFLILISTMLVSIAQVTFKTAWSTYVVGDIVAKVLLGFGLYAIGALLFMVMLRKKNVSYLFPFMTLSYVWVTILSAYFLGEAVSLVKIMGMGLIFTGIVLIYAGGKKQ